MGTPGSRVLTAMFRFIALCLVVKAAAGSNPTVTAPITLNPDCDWDYGTYGLIMLEKVKKTIPSEVDCYEYCSSIAGWAKRRKCICYMIDYKHRSNSIKWMSGPTCDD